ncbi:MAG: hypothetical protein AUJ51_12635 [Elusimicrobia bacterium CG1_02_56_21]|nr:MAG: hypothetical protein AUJ51_12635 [Elusimicrobia bacterium CG1_02_56_21]
MSPAEPSAESALALSAAPGWAQIKDRLIKAKAENTKFIVVLFLDVSLLGIDITLAMSIV